MAWTASGDMAAGLHRGIVEQSHDAIIFADRDGLIRLWNRGAETLFGYARHEVLGRNLDLIIPENFRRAHDEGYRRAMETGQLRHEGRVLVTRSQNKFGARLYLDLSFGLLKDDAGTVIGAFAIGRDCTARHLEQQAMRARASSPA
jgi:PAS domain S-box-containing protein